MRTYSSFCGTVCSDSTGTVTSDAAVRLHRRYQNYQLQFCFFFFAGADIHLCNCSSSAFQAGITGTFLSAGHNLQL